MTRKLLFLIIAFVQAAAITASPAGTTSVFDLGTSVRAQSLGGAYTAASGDPGCIYYNPAALNTLSRDSIEAAYIPLYFDTTYSYIIYALPTVDLGTFGFSGALMNTGNLVLRDAGGTKISDSSQSVFEAMAGWGKDFLDGRADFGVNAKIDYQNLANYAGDISAGIDASVFGNIIKDDDQQLDAGLAIKNLLEPSIKLGSGANTVPRRAQIGGAYLRRLLPDLSAQVFADITAPVGVAFDYAAGVEAAFYKVVFLRAGLNSYNIYSVGAGIELFSVFEIDYGMFISEIDTQHRLALKFSYGDDVPQLRRDKEKLEEARIDKKARELAAKELAQLRTQIDKMTGDVKSKEFFKAKHYTNGIEDYFNGDLKSSLAEFDTVYQEDPDYLNVRYYISMMKGLLSRSNQENYSNEILELYRDGVSKYLKQDYIGAKEAWEKILKIDKYNRLAVDNLKEVNSLLRDIEGMKGEK
jgi:hypothetical protein